MGRALAWTAGTLVAVWALVLGSLIWGLYDLRTWQTHRTLEIVHAGIPLPPRTGLLRADEEGSWRPLDSPPARTHEYDITETEGGFRGRLVRALEDGGWEVRPWGGAPCDLEARVGRLSLVADFAGVRGERHRCPGDAPERLELSLRLGVLTDFELRARW